MKFVKVNEVPEKLQYHKLKNCWTDFMNMNVKVAKVDLDVDEYKSPAVARTVMATSIKRFGFPIDVMRRKDEIYLVRRDI